MKTQVSKNPTDNRRAEAQEVIDILNRWDARMNGHQTQKRSHERIPYAGRLCLFPFSRHGTVDADRQGLTVWARNVSPKGIAFVYKGHIDWRRVLFCLDPDSGEATWMHAEVVRSRKVHNDFWDYGARFIRRARAGQIASVPSTTSKAERRLADASLKNRVVAKDVAKSQARPENNVLFTVVEE